MDRPNRRIFTAAAVLVLISLYGCEDTVAYVHNAFGGVDKLTTDSITGQTTVELSATAAPTERSSEE